MRNYSLHLLAVLLAFLVASSMDYSAELEREVVDLQQQVHALKESRQVSACDLADYTDYAYAEVPSDPTH